LIASHDAAEPHDVAGIAGHHALVDDRGVERRQVERGHRLHQLEGQDDRERPAVGA
jgi:hypothetical protein